MADFELPLTPEGAVTAPADALVLSLPSAEAETYLDVGEMNVLEIPEFGWCLADGYNPMRLVTQDAVYDCGGLAPSSAPTLAVTGGARATSTGTYAGQPSDGESFLLRGAPGGSTLSWNGNYLTIQPTFKNSLVTDGTLGHQVKIGADADETWANVQKFINGTGTQGTEYFNYWTFLGIEDDIQLQVGVEVSALVSPNITYRCVDYGSAGNSGVSTESVSNYSVTAFSGGTDGTGTAPSAGTRRYFFTNYRDADGAETGRSPIASITQATNTNVSLSGLTASADTTFDYTNIYRTAKGGVEFFLVGTIVRASTTFTDDVPDSDLPQPPWNDLLHRDYTEGPPPRGRALAFWKEAIWTIGAQKSAEYTREEVAVTNGSATISFVLAGTANAHQGVTARMVGRTFQVDGTAETYRILSVDESAGTAVIDREYEGTTDAHTTFKIVDGHDRTKLQRCVPFKYNQWPEEESPGSIETDDDEGGTALLATTARLFAFSRTSISALTGDDAESWDFNKVSEGIGVAGPRMVVGVGEGAVLLSPEDGFYAMSPTGELRSVSSPDAPKRTVATGIDRTVARIAWDNVNQGYSFYDKTDRIVVFGLPLDGANVPNYEFVLDLQNGTWALYKRSEWTANARITLPGGAPAYLSGDREGHLWHVNVGESDGFYGAEAVQTISSATVRTLTVSGTPFTTSEDGKPVLVLYQNGSTVAYAKVASSTTSVLTLAEDLDTAPVEGDQLVLGGIAWQFKSGFTTGGEEYHKKTLRSVTVRHAPTTRGEYFFSFAVDGGSFALCPVGTSIGDLSQANGKVRHKTQWPGDTHAINIRGFKPGGQAILRGGVFDFIVRSHGRV